MTRGVGLRFEPITFHITSFITYLKGGDLGLQIKHKVLSLVGPKKFEHFISIFLATARFVIISIEYDLKVRSLFFNFRVFQLE